MPRPALTFAAILEDKREVTFNGRPLPISSGSLMLLGWVRYTVRIWAPSPLPSTCRFLSRNLLDMTCFGRLGFRNGLFFREFVLSLCQSKTWVPDTPGCRSRTQYSYFSIASPFSLLCSTFGQDDHLSLRRNALQWQAQPPLSCNRSSAYPEPFTSSLFRTNMKFCRLYN